MDYRGKLTEAYLKIRKVKLSPSISIAHELALKKGLAIYPVRRVECKTFIIAAGNQSLRKDNLYNGLVPKTFVFGMFVDSAAFNGEYKKNPYNFKTYTTSFLGITVDGEEVPFKSLQLSYALSYALRHWKVIYDSGIDISRSDFANGYGMYVADLTPESSTR